MTIILFYTKVNIIIHGLTNFNFHIFFSIHTSKRGIISLKDFFNTYILIQTICSSGLNTLLRGAQAPHALNMGYKSNCHLNVHVLKIIRHLASQFGTNHYFYHVFFSLSYVVYTGRSAIVVNFCVNDL